MLLLQSRVQQFGILSLRTGHSIAHMLSPIVDPKNLRVVGYFVEDSRDKSVLILLPEDIREVMPQGFVVNDHEVLASPDELVRLKGLIQLQFTPIGKSVRTEGGKRLGKVRDWALDSKSNYVSRLFVTPAGMRSALKGNTSIERSQIIEINDKAIIINDIEQTKKAVQPLRQPA